MKRTEYRYQVGEVVNETLKIVSQTKLPKGKYKEKGYEVQSLVYKDAPSYYILETGLKNGSGCGYNCGRLIYEGNSLYSIKHLRPYIVDIEKSKTIPPKSNKTKEEFKCPECGEIREMTPNQLFYQGFSCNFCSSSISYPELFMMAYLEVKGIKYEYQKVFNDLPNKRFDFYLPESNTVIETHGLQHYKKCGLYDYNTTTLSDNIKESYCIKNNISYLPIDGSKSTFKFMKESIDKSVLSNISKQEYRIILKKIEKNKRYPTKKIISLYNSGYSSIKIGEKLGFSKTAILSVLHKNNISLRHNSRSIDFKSNKRKRIKCLNTNKVFDSIVEAQKYASLKGNSGIIGVCKGKRNYAGKHPITGEKLTWEYVD